MNILWLKDKKIGHEKQVKALLDELSKSREINIIESEVDYTFDDKLNEIFFGWFHKLTKTSLHTMFRILQNRLQVPSHQKIILKHHIWI